MTVVIEIVTFADGSPLPFSIPAWVEEFTEEEGLTVTSNRTRAKEFDTTVEAWDYYRQEFPQGILGFNPGGPNRPLTAFTVVIYDLETRDV